MKKLMRIDRPAQHFNANWREGLPLGNGIHGMLVYGYTGNEKIILSHTRLWRGGHTNEMPDVSDQLPIMRDLILQGRMPEADDLICKALRDRGYRTSESLPIPACDIRINVPAAGAFKKYERVLDMSREEASVTYFDDNGKHFRRAFVSFADDVNVIECEADAAISMTVHATDEAKAYAVRAPKLIEYVTEDGWQYISQEEDGQEHGVVLRVVRSEKRTLLLAKVYYENADGKAWERLRGELEAITPDYALLMRRHLKEYKKAFGNTVIELDDANFEEDALNSELLNETYRNEMPNRLAERMWYYGRYLLVCGTRKGGLPCPLLGLWNGEYQAFWAMNMANINLEMIYWQALSGDLAELMLPVFDYYESGLEEMRENARKLYGMRGIYLTAVSTPATQKLTCVMPHIANWTAGAGWISELYFDYYLWTADEKFLKERAYPFMREAAMFYEDYLVWQGNKWMMIPSVSPENHTGDYKHLTKNGGDGTVDEEMQSSINATMDIAVIKELFGNLISVADICGATTEEVEAWKAIVAGAPAYDIINEDGAVREWRHPDYPDRYHHRHQSHLYPIFPGRELAEDEGSRDKFHKGGIIRMTEGIDSQTSWSLTQNANFMARCKDGENAWKSLNYIAKTTLLGNLFTVHNDWRENGITMQMNQAPFQIDANIGWSSAMQEMLLYSSVNMVEILPALPEKWKKGKALGLTTMNGLKVDTQWNRNGGTTVMTALRDTSFKLVTPDGNVQQLSMKKGEIKQIGYKFSK